MSDLNNPEGSNANPVRNSNEMDEDSSPKDAVPPHVSFGESSKKKSLQWDEDNLLSNAAEMERTGPRMKIDEPKTPFAGSETGSSTSGSAHQSPPESPHFIPGEHLVGFQSLEQGMRRSGVANTPSDTHSSAGSASRSVHISDEIPTSGGSSPRSREEFAARRRAHYKNEAHVRTEEWRRTVYEEEEEDDGDGIEKEPSRENHHTDSASDDMDTQHPNGVAEGRTQPQGADPTTNGHSEGGEIGRNDQS